MSRTFPLVILVLATLLGGGGGYLTNTAIAYLVALPDGAETPKVPGPNVVGTDKGSDKGSVAAMRPSRGTTDKQYLETITCRNLFDPSKIGDCAVENGPTGGTGEPQTDLALTLLGTLVAEPAQYSSALIQTEGEDRARGYSIEDTILGAKVVKIEKKRVTLLRNGNEEILTMDEESAKPPSGPKAAASTGDDEVTTLGENEFAIDRSTIDKYLSDLEGLSRMGRALLHRGPDGEFDGYRLSAIRRNTIADKLGIRNGDIIHSVNGMPLNSMQSAMEAYNTMQNDANFSLEVSRRGQKQEMKYTIQ